jgi:hypothetical protein
MEKEIKVLTLEDIKKGCEYDKNLNWFYENFNPMNLYDSFKLRLELNNKPLYFICRENTNVITSTAKDSPDWFIKTFGGVDLPLKTKPDLLLSSKHLKEYKDRLLELGGELTKDEVSLLKANSVGKKNFIDVDEIPKGVFRYSLMMKIASLTGVVEGGDEILCVIYP